MTPTRRARVRIFIAGLLLLLSVGPSAAETKYGIKSGLRVYGTKYGITAKADKNTDFSTLKTYAWTPGWEAFPMADQQIVAAVERELAALGFHKGTPETSDVTVTYASLSRTDVNVKSKKAPDGTRPSYAVATLVVLLREPGTTRDLFRARLDIPIDLDPSALEETINQNVARMFAEYPSRRRASHR